MKEDTRKELSNEAERSLTRQEEAEFSHMVEVLEKLHAIDQARKGNTLFLIDYLQQGDCRDRLLRDYLLDVLLHKVPVPKPRPAVEGRTASIGNSRSKWRWISLCEVIAPKRRPVFWRTAG